ncbi:alkaline phosphatase D family protein [Chitinophaga rhizosphaerae]|uniref:alkaline phosphatase D family protein n=1 Tax=Chitinophaga rhizosphaerae TaxID=1864947 RepID=UPI000F804414|nr:alkaline phosphatase D family protein [Chitinophaga rhizosphaerae]
MRAIPCILFVLFLTFPGIAQHKGLVAGPMTGSVELRDAIVWVEVAPTVKQVAVRFWPKGQEGRARTQNWTGQSGRTYLPVKLQLVNLDPATEYEYEVVIDKIPAKKSSFKTKTLWQYRMPAPDFTFLTGSCAYFNEDGFDRPGKPYGKDSSIFLTMAKEKADFMLWLGDNWYTREVDYHSAPGLAYRAHRDRSLPVLQPFLSAMPHYATWDDHDFGPNDASKAYIFRDESRAVFMDYWPNPTFGRDGKGIYTQFSFNDVDFFLLDGRYFSSGSRMPDSIGGKPNAEKKMYGDEQMEWLRNALLQSNARFKVVATGSQALNVYSRWDSFHHFPVEYQSFMDWLNEVDIPGIVFLTGDRHHSEVVKMDRPGNYPLYDITNSPLTSGEAAPSGIEVNSPIRVAGTLVVTQNYSRIKVLGPQNDRRMQVEFVDRNGRVLGKFEVAAQELKK